MPQTTHTSRGLPAVLAVPVVNGKIDSYAVLEHIPAAITDPGGNGWPPKHDDERLIPTIWLAIQQLAGLLGDIPFDGTDVPFDGRPQGEQ